MINSLTVVKFPPLWGPDGVSICPSHMQAPTTKHYVLLLQQGDFLFSSERSGLTISLSINLFPGAFHAISLSPVQIDQSIIYLLETEFKKSTHTRLTALFPGLPGWAGTRKEQEAQLSPRDRAMRRVNWNLANCHATVQKLLIRQVLTKSMVWSWRFSRRQCVIDNVHSIMTPSSRLPLSQVS